jgi:hypothetical protein
MRILVRMLVIGLGFLTLLANPAWAREEQRITLSTRPGVTQSFYFTQPEGPVVATLVLFPGGDGTLHGYGPPELTHGNFLVRSRGLFLTQGFAVAVLDVPSDQSAGLDGFRLSPDHVVDIAAAVDWLRKSGPAPVWLIGTSLGTLSAVTAAGRVPGIAGLVLTSTVTRASKRSRGTVFDAGLAGLHLPVLVVHHREDGCFASPSSDTGEIMRQLGSAAKAELILVEGGNPPRSGPCMGLSAHGYFGIEAKVVTAIADWIRAK